MFMSLQIRSMFDESNKQWGVYLDGEIDIYTAEKLKGELLVLIDDKKESIKIHCENLQYIDSTGLGVLIVAYKHISEAGKQIIIKNAKPSIKKLLVITGLNKVFNVEEWGIYKDDVNNGG